jgi:3-phenylpropionate/trans-cinnamate dioxygenase ferredoxin reductase subunit
MVIVGGGECAARCALELHRCGYAGPITIIGEETHLPYERPPLSKDFMTGIAALPPAVAAQRSYDDAGVQIVRATGVISIDRSERSVLLTTGHTIEFERLLLATGAVARHLDVPMVGENRPLTLRSLDDASLIQAAIGPGTRMLIVGGGLIGLELAASAEHRGAAVTVVEAARRVMLRGVPAEIAAVASARHRAEGISLLCGETVASVAAGDDATTVTLTSGREIAVDLLVAAVGVDPATTLAEAAGLSIENGIAVDEQLETSDRRIFAAGDCCSFPLAIYGGRRVRLESWRNAVEQGELAARNMLGAGEPVSTIPWFWSEQHDLVLQVAGLCEAGTEVVRRDLAHDAFVLFHLDARGRLVAASGIGPATAVAKQVSLAERLIHQRAHPGASELASSEFNLKNLLLSHGPRAD